MQAEAGWPPLAALPVSHLRAAISAALDKNHSCLRAASLAHHHSQQCPALCSFIQRSSSATKAQSSPLRSSSAAPAAELGTSAVRGHSARAPPQTPVLAGALRGQPGRRKPPAVQLQCRSRASNRQFYHRGSVSGNITLNLITTIQDAHFPEQLTVRLISKIDGLGERHTREIQH